ncbi:MAG: Orn/Lys/Arg decarboxylase N-terminal domain-containing protein [Candidatus Malihini olakiniferum]
MVLVSGRLHTQREIVSLGQTDFTDVAAVVVSLEEARCEVLLLLQYTGFGIPAFVLSKPWCSQEKAFPSGKQLAAL